MFCQECGGKIGESQRFCGLCGTTVPVRPQQTRFPDPSKVPGPPPEVASLSSNTAESKPKRKLSRFARIVLWTLGILLGLFVLEHSNTEDSTPRNSPSATAVAPQETAPTDSSQPQPSERALPTYQTGQQFSIGYWSFLCHNAHWTPVLGYNPYSMERANADFVVIDITAQNDDTSASTLPPFKLMDKEGRIYDVSSAGMLSQGFFSVLESLNPGVAKRGSIAFDVPPDRQYVLLVSGGIESGKQAIVVLPLSAPAATDDQIPGSSN